MHDKKTHADFLLTRLFLRTGTTEETAATGALPQSAVLHRKRKTLLVRPFPTPSTCIFLTTRHPSSSLSNLWCLPLVCGTSERKSRHLYYSDLRERVLRSECRQQEEVYFQLAGYALQASLGDHHLPREGMEVTPYFEPKEYFPPWVGGSI